MAGKPKPRRGAGHRSMDCAHYEACLGLAAKQDWKTFNCESCEHGGQDHGKGPATIPKKQNTRLCECGKITLSPNCPYCPSCMAKRSNKKSAKKETKPKRPRGRPPNKQATESLTEALKKENTTQDILISEKSLIGPNTALTIDFGKYSPILREVEKLAEEELRPVGLQVVYILKHYLDERQVDG